MDDGFYYVVRPDIALQGPHHDRVCLYRANTTLVYPTGPEVVDLWISNEPVNQRPALMLHFDMQEKVDRYLKKNKPVEQ